MKISKKLQSKIISYLDNELSAEETTELEKNLKAKDIPLEELKDIKQSLQNTNRNIPLPSSNMKKRFYSMLQEEENKIKSNSVNEDGGILDYFSRRSIFIASAAASITLLIGLAIGYYSNNFKNDILSKEIGKLQEKIVFAMIDEADASDRLKAVEMSTKLDLNDSKVVNSLFKTLNSDPNANVRFEALDLLVSNASNPSIQVRLIQSIENQDDPLMQYSIAQSMARLGATDAIPHLERLLLKPNIVEPVRTVIADSINILRNNQLS